MSPADSGSVHHKTINIHIPESERVSPLDRYDSEIGCPSCCSVATSRPSVSLHTTPPVHKNMVPQAGSASTAFCPDMTSFCSLHPLSTSSNPCEHTPQCYHAFQLCTSNCLPTRSKLASCDCITPPDHLSTSLKCLQRREFVWHCCH
jgi:hypothetical protein